MARLRRRKQRLQWFPNLGTKEHQEDDFPDFAAYRSVALFPTVLTADTKTLDLTFDQSAEVDLVQNQLPTLADWQQSAWRLRRFVGKFFVWQVPITDPQADLRDVSDVLVTAGLIVLRTEEPTGTPLLAAASYDPQLNQNIRDPWIWRRSWMLSPGAIAGPASGVFTETDGVPFPNFNGSYGSIQDGPHIDAKTNRVISDEARLFFVVNARVPAISTGETIAPLVEGILDYRMLGSTMKATNRRNATR